MSAESNGPQTFFPKSQQVHGRTLSWHLTKAKLLSLQGILHSLLHIKYGFVALLYFEG